jgi:hypothetical protein
MKIFDLHDAKYKEELKICQKHDEQGQGWPEYIPRANRGGRQGGVAGSISVSPTILFSIIC